MKKRISQKEQGLPAPLTIAPVRLVGGARKRDSIYLTHIRCKNPCLSITV